LPVPANLSSLDALRFNVRTATPSRVSVQLRFNSHGGARWARSVYVTPQDSEAAIILKQLKSVEGTSPMPPLPSASSLLFVIDLTNAKPGQKGTLQISNVAFGQIGN
jgi:hypothetical protein